MKELNANTVRIYTTLSPDFYASLKEFNDAEMAAGRKPLLVLHGIWSPEEELNDDEAGTDAFRTDLTNHFYRNIESVVGAVHGAGYFEVRRARTRADLPSWGAREAGALTPVAVLGAPPWRLARTAPEPQEGAVHGGRVKVRARLGARHRVVGARGQRHERAAQRHAAVPRHLRRGDAGRQSL